MLEGDHMDIRLCNLALFSSNTKYLLILSGPCLEFSGVVSEAGACLQEKKPNCIRALVCSLHSFECAAGCQASHSKAEQCL